MEATRLDRGKRFESIVRDAMTEQDIPSVSELARRTGTGRDTWYQWFRGERRPRSGTLALRATAVLGLTVAQLMEPWAGPTPNDEALRVLVRDAVAEGVEEAMRRIREGRDDPEPRG